MVMEEEEKKANGLGIEKDFGVPRATACGKELRREKMLVQNIAIDYELDKIYCSSKDTSKH